jgi:hypothetical protein
MCSPPIFSRQQLSETVTAATNTHATIEELLDASFSIESVPYQRRVCGSVYAPNIARQRFGKNITATTTDYWRFVFYAVRVVSKESRSDLIFNVDFFSKILQIVGDGQMLGVLLRPSTAGH